jgi:DNA-binding transcriptional MerR regulator
MHEPSFETGVTSGMTGIPKPTMNRYVQTFNKYFSQTATQTRRGRRFTVKDVDLLATIRNLLSTGYDIEAVEAELDKGWSSFTLPSEEIRKAAKICEQAQLDLDTTRRLIEKFRGEVADPAQKDGSVIQDMNAEIVRTRKLLNQVINWIAWMQLPESQRKKIHYPYQWVYKPAADIVSRDDAS